MSQSEVDTANTAATGTVAMDAARDPSRPGAVTVVGMVLALMVTILGVVAVRDALLAAGLLDGSPWLEAVIEPLDGLTPAFWAVPVAIALIALGLWLLLAALRPRPRTSVAVQAQTGVFLRPRDLERLAATAAEGVDGVLTAKVSATRRKVAVTATSTGDPATGESVRDVVEHRLAPLATPLAVRVRTITEGGDR